MEVAKFRGGVDSEGKGPGAHWVRSFDDVYPLAEEISKYIASLPAGTQKKLDMLLTPLPIFVALYKCFADPITAEVALYKDKKKNAPNNAQRVSRQVSEGLRTETVKQGDNGTGNGPTVKSNFVRVPGRDDGLSDGVLAALDATRSL